MDYSLAMLVLLVLAPTISSSMNIKERRLHSLSEIRKTLAVLQNLLIYNADKRHWFPEDLSDQGMTDIDAKLLIENEEKVKTTFDKTKMKQKFSIPRKMQMESPMFRGRRSLLMNS